MITQQDRVDNLNHRILDGTVWDRLTDQLFELIEAELCKL